MIDPYGHAGPWITAAAVNFFHGSRQVLRNIDLRFRPGRHYIVAGPNGAGKSTFLDILANLKQPASGTIDLFGRPGASYEPRERARLVALAPQDAHLDFAFTVREIVGMGRRPHLGRWGTLAPEDHAVIDEAVRRLHLDELADRPVTALSGGEKRRCVVARALAQTTPILLLDEPNAGLDIVHALALMALARKLAEDGALVLTVSHDLSLAATFGHEAIFLKSGEVVAAGPIAATFTDDILSRVYDTEAHVGRDDFSGGLAVSFRMDPRVPPRAS